MKTVSCAIYLFLFVSIASTYSMEMPKSGTPPTAIVSNPAANLNELPVELKELIAQFLVDQEQNITKLIKQIYRLSHVNQEWRCVIKNPQLWKIIFKNFFRPLLIELNSGPYNGFKSKVDKFNQDFETINKAIESIKTLSKEKQFDQEIADILSSAFSSVFEEITLHMKIIFALCDNDQTKANEIIDQSMEIITTSGQDSVWDTLILHRPIVLYKTELVKKLIPLISKAGMNAKDKYGNTALIAAIHGTEPVCSDQKIKIIKMLIKHNSDINAKDDVNGTPLMYASHYGHKEIVQMLLDNHASINSKDKDGLTALDYAIANDTNKEELIGLLANKIIKDKATLIKSIIDITYDESRNVRLKAIKVLLKLDTDFIIKVLANSADGYKSYSDSVRNKFEEIIKFLLKFDTDLNKKDSVGRTLLIYASYLGLTKVVEKLLSKNAQVNLKDEYGQTALMYASSEGHLLIVKMLLEKNPDINIKDNAGKTALSLATSNKQDEIAEILRNHHACK